MKQKLFKIGLSEQAVSWFCNYLSHRTQSVKSDISLTNLCFDVLSVTRGAPQGSVLGPLVSLFI